MRAFGETANPAEYVPREASEEALAALVRAVRGGRVTALTAPPGLGKSLLLRLLALRLSPGFACPFLPYAAVRLDELCDWVLGLLDEAADEEPVGDLLRCARRLAEQGTILVLLVDDAGSMPLATARGLGALIRESGNRIRVVVGAADDAASSRVLAALHPEVVEVRFRAPMTRIETRHYVETRLEQSAAPPSLRERFDPEAIGRIHRLSAGVPRCVHDLALSLLDEPPQGVGRSWQEERWLGAPIDDPDGPIGEDDDVAMEEEDEPESVQLPETLLDGDDPELW